MRTSKPITIYVPELVIQRLNTYLKKNPPSFRYDILKFYYVVHHIIVKQLNRKDQEFICINKTNLKLIIGCNYDKYIKTLRNGDFIVRNKYYIPGEIPYKYKLNPKYKTDTIPIELYPNTSTFNKIIKIQRLKKKHNCRLEPFLKRMLHEFENIDMDYAEAEKWIYSQPDKRKQASYLTSLSMIKDKRFRRFNRNRTNNRLDTNFTNMPSELRQFIIGNYVSIDLKNSQPFFFGLLIQRVINTYKGILCSFFDFTNLHKTFGKKPFKHILKFPQIQEKQKMGNFRSYFDSCKKGTLYDDFINSYPGKITRDKVKETTFKVLFSKDESYYNFDRYIPYKNEKEIFAEVFPFVAEVVHTLKQKDHRLLPIFLQKLESYIFIDIIARKLVEADIVPLTIHDSVIVKRSDQEQALKIMQDVFYSEFGVIPTFKIENLRSEKIDTLC